MIPHFDWPLRYVSGTPVVNEQGTDKDVAACVTAICLTRPGDLYDDPAFGLPDPTFEQEPILPASIARPIERWEPRAVLVASTAPNIIDAAVVNANIEVGVKK